MTRNGLTHVGNPRSLPWEKLELNFTHPCAAFPTKLVSRARLCNTFMVLRYIFWLQLGALERWLVKLSSESHFVGGRAFARALRPMTVSLAYGPCAFEAHLHVDACLQVCSVGLQLVVAHAHLLFDTPSDSPRLAPGTLALPRCVAEATQDATLDGRLWDHLNGTAATGYLQQQASKARPQPTRVLPHSFCSCLLASSDSAQWPWPGGLLCTNKTRSQFNPVCQSSRCVMGQWSRQ